MFHMEATNLAAMHLAKLKALGFDVLATDDFKQVEAFVQQTGKPLRSPMFDTRRNDFTEGRAFWLFLKKGGQVVGGIAAQSIPLGSESFTHYIKRTTAAQYSIEVNLINVARPLEDRLKGHLIYLGDLHISDAARGKRQVLREFCGVAKYLCALTWPTFDWMFGHIPYEHRSLQDVYRFSQITHGAFTWGEPRPSLRTDDMAVVYHSKIDLLHDLYFQKAHDAAENQREG